MRFRKREDGRSFNKIRIRALSITKEDLKNVAMGTEHEENELDNSEGDRSCHDM